MNLWELYITEYFGEGAFTEMYLTFHATDVWVTEQFNTQKA